MHLLIKSLLAYNQTHPDANRQRSLPGQCSLALAELTSFQQEVRSIIALSNSSHLPLGYGFLMAEGLRLTPKELLISQSEKELQVSDWLLSQSKRSLQLAAFSSESQLRSMQQFMLMSHIIDKK